MIATAYDQFKLGEVSALMPLERAEFHARHAEWLLDSVTAGTYVITPVAVSAAQVHAQLATAWAKIAEGHAG